VKLREGVWAAYEKSDLAQLGVILWSLIKFEKAPAKFGALLPLDDQFPSYLHYIISNCRGEIRHRLPADALLLHFDRGANDEQSITWV